MGGNVCAVFNTGNDYHRGTVSIILISDILFVAILGTITFRAWLRSRQPKITGPETEIGSSGVFRTILVMGIAFAICIFPRDMLLVSFHLKKVFPPLIEGLENETANGLGLLKVLYTSYSCMNFIIYMALNPVFRKELFDKFKVLKKFRKVAVSPMIASPQILNHSGTNLKESKIDVSEDFDNPEKTQEECKINIPEDFNQYSDKSQEELKPDIPKVCTPFHDQVDVNQKEPEVDVSRSKVQQDVIDVRVIACTPTTPEVAHEVLNAPLTPDVDQEVDATDFLPTPDVDQEIDVPDTPISHDVDRGELPLNE